MRTMKIQEALDTIASLIRGRASPFLILQVLVSDGFELRQAETILRWSIQTVNKEKERKK